MKRNFILIPLLAIALGSCSKWTAIQNTRDYEYKYEVAKAYYMEGKYSQASVYFAEVLAFMKGTVNAEESLYLAAITDALGIKRSLFSIIPIMLSIAFTPAGLPSTNKSLNNSANL